jgi:hypothetical protein
MGFSFTWDSNNILYTSLFFICRFWIWFFSILSYFLGITWVFIESCVSRVSFYCFGIAFFKIFSSDIQFCLFLNLAIILYSEIWPSVGKPRTDSVPPTMQSQIPKSRNVTLFFLDMTLYKWAAMHCLRRHPVCFYWISS